MGETPDKCDTYRKTKRKGGDTGQNMKYVQCEWASPPSVSPKQFLSLKLSGETPKNVTHIHTERLTEKGGHRTYIHTERLTEEGGTPDIHTYIRKD